MEINWNQHLTTAEAYRDEAWENLFLKHFPATQISVVDENIRKGPDGFGYLLLKMDPQGENPADEPANKVMSWAFDKGVGLVLNSHKMVPDYVFTHGMLWYFSKTGKFQEPMNKKSGVVEISFADNVFGPAAEEYWPQFSRDILRDYLATENVKLHYLVVTTKDYQHTDLCLTEESFSTLPSPKRNQLIEKIRWFLPPHYSVVLVSEKNLPKSFSL